MSGFVKFGRRLINIKWIREIAVSEEGDTVVHFEEGLSNKTFPLIEAEADALIASLSASGMIVGNIEPFDPNG